MIIKDSSDKSKGALFDASGYAPTDMLLRGNGQTTPVGGFYPSDIVSDQTKNTLVGFNGSLTSSASLKISALRSATASHKYKEIQNSNDPDFANQVLAHFGIKPKVDARTSIFIGGDDKTLSINPQVNTNFLDGGQPDTAAIVTGKQIGRAHV